MNEKFYDPIVAEVRKNREELLAEFGGDTKKLTEYLAAKRPAREAAGVRYETADERQARLAWSRQQEEAENRRVASL
jgi:hypothetical protein